MWFVYSILFALWSATSIFITKRLTKSFDPLPLLFLVFLFYLPSTFIVLLLTGGIPHVTTSFYVYMLVSAILDAAAFLAFYKAISLSPISLVAPIQSFSPLITTLFAIIILGETPTPVKFIGMILIVTGVYLLNVSDIKEGIFSPIKNLVAERGVQLSFLTTLIWAFTPIIQKRAIFETSPQTPLYASLIGILFVTLILVPLAARKTIKFGSKIPGNLKWLVICGVGGALGQLAAYNAFALTNVGYATAIFSTSIFFVVSFGGVFLKEKRLPERILASLVMFGGILLLVL